ncbi:YcnI family protein [Streptomyces malaysiensis subsp. malaysiensis]|uniref:YcnI family copper-binding membrane protein n=1 Tax=Streptomyces sp. NA07423 TaxID=3042026 RepID=UPI0024BF18E2|nr:YcnI family protein [Streptomyces sp. NA07423]WHX24214.1 YcnI family protein [Streptomyces sp. NA07423]
MRLRRLPVIGCLTAGGLVLLTAGPAFAHVSVQPGQAEKGGYSTINFKVPNERDDSSTVKLEVNLPADHPLASVMPQPVPGWGVKVTKSKLAKPMEVHGEKINEAVTKVTWTGGKIEPGTFQQFPLSVGQLPEDADQLVFKALQTYDNKEVVRWIEEPQEGAAEPENPAPVLKLVAPAKGSDGQDAAAASGQGQGKDSEKAGAENSASEDASDDKDGSDTTARVLGIAGIVIGAAGVAFGVVASRRRSA